MKLTWLAVLIPGSIGLTVAAPAWGQDAVQSTKPLGPTLELSYRHTALAQPGAEGETHAAGITLFPFHAVTAMRFLRFGVGADCAFRAGANGHTDTLGQMMATVGLQLPSKLLVPYLVALAGGGFVLEDRFQRSLTQVVYTLGAEAGGTLRVGPVGAGAALGFGRTVEGSVYTNTFWLRAMVTFF